MKIEKVNSTTTCLGRVYLCTVYIYSFIHPLCIMDSNGSLRLRVKAFPGVLIKRVCDAAISLLGSKQTMNRSIDNCRNSMDLTKKMPTG